MERIKYFNLFEDNTADGNEAGKSLLHNQNDIPGSSPNSPVALFSADMSNTPITVDSIPGYNFIMASEDKELFLLEGREVHLIFLGSPFGRADYTEFLNSLPDYVLSMLKERIEHYGFKESPNSFMFGINGTIRVLNAKNDGMYYLAYPSNDGVDYEVVSNINNTSLADTFLNMVERVVGKKIMFWLHTKFAQLQNNPDSE